MNRCLRPAWRLASATKTDAGTTVSMESYVHDANNNVTTQTVGGVTTDFTYDRNRLRESLTAGATAAYNYDPFDRLDTVTSGGQVIERHTYDGFDRIATDSKPTLGGAILVERDAPGVTKWLPRPVALQV